MLQTGKGVGQRRYACRASQVGQTTPPATHCGHIQYLIGMLQANENSSCSCLCCCVAMSGIRLLSLAAGKAQVENTCRSTHLPPASQCCW
jgi:hypothetical protein